MTNKVGTIHRCIYNMYNVGEGSGMLMSLSSRSLRQVDRVCVCLEKKVIAEECRDVCRLLGLDFIWFQQPTALLFARRLLIDALLFDVANAVDGHVVLGDEGGYLQLIHVDDAVQIFDARHRMDLIFNGRRHKRQEPPGHDLNQKNQRSLAGGMKCSKI